eukprot:6258755-Amphidinium_carterae.1
MLRSLTAVVGQVVFLSWAFGPSAGDPVLFQYTYYDLGVAFLASLVVALLRLLNPASDYEDTWPDFVMGPVSTACAICRMAFGDIVQLLLSAHALRNWLLIGMMLALGLALRLSGLDFAVQWATITAGREGSLLTMLLGLCGLVAFQVAEFTILD